MDAKHLAFAVAVPWGILGTWVSILLATRLGIVARPKEIVPQHTRDTALLGGLGVAIGIAGSLISLSLLGTRETSVTAIGIPALAFLALGTIDDIYPLSPLVKLSGQCAIAVYAVGLGLWIPAFTSPIVGKCAAALWFVLIVNAFNLTDVCDGLLASLCVWSMLFLTTPSHQPELAMGTAGACMGFLVFNRPSATIFLGDGGSHLLGFVAGALAMTALQRSNPVSSRACFQSMLYVGVPIGEMLFLIYARTRKGMPFWLASSDHFSLRLQAAGFSQWQTILIASLAAIELGSLAHPLGLQSWIPRSVAVLILVLSAAVALNWLMRHPTLNAKTEVASVQ